jgi:signal transduction histidine kinase
MRNVVRPAFLGCCCCIGNLLVSCGMATLFRRFGKQPKVLLFMESFAIAVLIGVLDHLGGWRISLFVFYAIPIGMASWHVGRLGGGGIALVCGAIWYWANGEVHPYGTQFAFAWTAFNRTGYFVFVAIGVGAMRRRREESLARAEILGRTRELEEEMVRVCVSEQMRIGQYLHDGLCQNLVAIDCAAACLRADLEAKSIPETAAAERIQGLLKTTIMEARELARGIFPVLMNAEGFAMALEDLVNGVGISPNVNVTFDDHGDVDVTNSQTAMHLYRIAQQAVSNALTHAEAKNITVSLQKEGGRGVMRIMDDGCGMVKGDGGRGIGMKTMAYRVHLIGGEIVVESVPNVGTKIHCHFPL